MDVLVVLGIIVVYVYFVSVVLYGVVIGILLLMYFEVSVMFIIFVFLGKYLEVFVKGKILEVIGKLL